MGPRRGAFPRGSPPDVPEVTARRRPRWPEAPPPAPHRGHRAVDHGQLDGGALDARHRGVGERRETAGQREEPEKWMPHAGGTTSRARRWLLAQAGGRTSASTRHRPASSRSVALQPAWVPPSLSSAEPSSRSLTDARGAWSCPSSCVPRASWRAAARGRPRPDLPRWLAPRARWRGRGPSTRGSRRTSPSRGG